MFFASQRFRRAAAKYGERLPRVLTGSFGPSERYTPQQVQRAVGIAGLNPRFIAIAYAAYLSQPDFDAVCPVKPGVLDYAMLREIYLKAVPVHADSHSEFPVRMNPEAFWGAGSPPST
ncbi:MAG TPA: hypothetical protein VMS78_16795 [Rhizomicrobium sp.]|nr:hypothetical protein [Rhizomicrobium sp.]